MDVHHIRYFLAVCDTLNFTRAAERCNVTQPALSRAIQQLEEEVSGLLFRRERNSTQLTELGMLMRPRLQQILDDLGTAKREAKQFLTMEQASFTLGIMCTVGPTRFTGILGQFYGTHPGISLNIAEGTPEKLAKALEAGEIDVAIMSQPEEFHPRFDVQLLFRERFLVAFTAGHRFSALQTVPLSSLNGESYLGRLNCEYAKQIDGVMAGSNCAVKVVYESEREDWIQNMVAGGMGICIIPEFSAIVPGLQTRPIVGPEIQREVCLVSMAGRRYSPAVSSFVKMIKGIAWPQTRFETTYQAA